MIAKMKEIVRLLKKYRRMGWVSVDLFWVLVFSVSAIVGCDWFYIVFALSTIVMVCWECSDVCLFEKLEQKDAEIKECKKRIEDLKGDLNIASDLLSNNKANPIKSNRIVSDKTFAVRLRSFMHQIQPCDAASEEEVNYFIHVAEKLLSWQTKTVRRLSGEAEYLQRLGLMPTEPEQKKTEAHQEAPKEESAKEAPAEPRKKPAARKKKPKKEVTTDSAPETNETQN